MPAFRALVHQAFGRRRKTLRNALLPGRDPRRLDAAFNAAEVDPRRRAESLAVAEFVRLWRALNRAGGAIQ
ncbi:MAG: hypothetical protein D6696_12525 [Acidobacteria bacterium]|nr:MAG: hypothetical protein D6696_12525 [Acidobacteriota bacterium]